MKKKIRLIDRVIEYLDDAVKGHYTDKMVYDGLKYILKTNKIKPITN